MPYSLYLHIPYCKSRCRYCNFYTRPGSHSVPDAYVEALLRDFYRYAPADERTGVPLPPQSVYFGGGTPALLGPAQVARVLQAVCPAADAEITLEANPDACPDAHLHGWRAAGVNRLSLGVQSARAQSLRSLGRTHTAQDTLNALRRARRAGFANLCADMMLALPGYTMEELDETADLLAQGDVTHVSAYLLKIEPAPRLPSEDEAAAFYEHAAEKLAAAGYGRYEISSFARPGFEGRHNRVYWDGGSWLGLGPAAHSCLEGRRFSFPPDVDAFLANALPPRPEGAFMAEDYIMLRLRLSEGLDEAALQSRYGVCLTGAQRALLAALCRSGHAVRTPGGWALTTRGMLVQNVILAQLL